MVLTVLMFVRTFPIVPFVLGWIHGAHKCSSVRSPGGNKRAAAGTGKCERAEQGEWMNRRVIYSAVNNGTLRAFLFCFFAIHDHDCCTSMRIHITLVTCRRHFNICAPVDILLCMCRKGKPRGTWLTLVVGEAVPPIPRKSRTCCRRLQVRRSQYDNMESYFTFDWSTMCAYISRTISTIKSCSHDSLYTSMVLHQWIQQQLLQQQPLQWSLLSQQDM